MYKNTVFDNMKKALLLLLLSLTKQKLLSFLHMSLVASVYNSTIKSDPKMLL